MYNSMPVLATLMLNRDLTFLYVVQSARGRLIIRKSIFINCAKRKCGHFLLIALISRIDEWYFVFNLPSDSALITIASLSQKLRTSYNSGAVSLQLSKLDEKVTLVLTVHFVPIDPSPKWRPKIQIR